MKNWIFISVLALFIFSCGEDDTETPIMNEASMEVIKDGVMFTATDFNNTLLEENQGGEIGRRLDLRANVDNGFLIVTISNWDWQNPPENGVLTKSYDTNVDDIGPNTDCMMTSSFTFCDGGLGTYLINNETFISEGIDDEESGVITITANDATNRTVSGTFDFIVGNFITNENITLSGTFSNLRY